MLRPPPSGARHGGPRDLPRFPTRPSSELPEAAFEEVLRQRGKQCDPEASDAFLSIKNRIIQEMQSETKKINMQQKGMLRLAVM